MRITSAEGQWENSWRTIRPSQSTLKTSRLLQGRFSSSGTLKSASKLTNLINPQKAFIPVLSFMFEINSKMPDDIIAKLATFLKTVGFLKSLFTNEFPLFSNPYFHSLALKGLVEEVAISKEWRDGWW